MKTLFLILPLFLAQAHAALTIANLTNVFPGTVANDRTGWDLRRTQMTGNTNLNIISNELVSISNQLSTNSAAGKVNQASGQATNLTANSLDIVGKLTLSSIVSASITANQHNYSPTGWSTNGTILRISSDAERTITGLAHDGTANRFVHAINVGSNPILFTHQDTASATTNRFIVEDGAFVRLAAGAVTDLFYDGSDSRWRVLGIGTVKATGGTTARALSASLSDIENVASHGALGDGSNDTAAVKAAYDRLVTKGGGVLFFPPSSGKYLFNLVITNNNIGMEGVVHDVNVNTNYGIGPWDTTLPTVQVGNDTAYVNGFSMHNLAVFGTRGTTNSPGALHLLGGAWRGDISYCQFIGGADTIRLAAGTNFPCTLNAISHFAAWDGTNSTVLVDDTRSTNVNSFCTGTYFSDGNINGHNTTGYAIRVITGRLNLVNVYLDGTSDHTIYLQTGGNISAVNSDLENATGEAGYTVTVDYTSQSYTERNLERFIYGSGARIQGKVKWVDTSGTVETQLPTGGGLVSGFDLTTFRKPFVTVPLKFGTVLNPYDSVYSFDMDGTNGPLTLGKSGGRDLDFRLLGTNTYLTFGTNGLEGWLMLDGRSTNTPNYVKLFRNTSNTNILGFDIHKGDGTATLEHALRANSYSSLAISQNLAVGDIVPTSKLHVDGAVTVNDDAYGAGWNGALTVPTKNALFDKIETLGSGGNWTASGTTNSTLAGNAFVYNLTATNSVTVADDVYDATDWNGSLIVPTQNAVRDKIEALAAGSTVWVNGNSVSSPNFTNSPTIVWGVTASTNAAPHVTNLTSASVLEKTGTGAIVLSSGPTLTNPIISGSMSMTGGPFLMIWTNGATLTNGGIDRALTNSLPQVNQSNVTFNAAVTIGSSSGILEINSGVVGTATAGTDYVAPSTTITVAGTANEITSSAGAQDLSANRTWTLSIHSDITRDTEWNTIAKIETATGVNILINTEIDDAAKLAAIQSDEQGSSGGYVRAVGATMNDVTFNEFIKLPADAAPTLDADYKFAIDTAIIDHRPSPVYRVDSTNYVVISMPFANLTSVDGHVLTYSAGTGAWTMAAPGSGTDGAAIHDDVAGEIAAIADKATPVGADHMLIEDSAAGDAKKDITIASLETAMEAVLDLDQLQGSVTDAQVPDAIALSANTVTSNITYTVETLAPVSGGTNFVLNLLTAEAARIVATNDVFWLNTTNRVADTTQERAVKVRILGSGANRLVTLHSSWMLAGSTTRTFTVTNGTWWTGSVLNTGASESNNFAGFTYAQ